MKAVISNLIFGVLCLTVLGIGSAHAGTFGDFTYTVLGDSTIEITDYPTSAVGDLIIPETINGTNVTSIGDWAFASCVHLTEISIPDGMTNIADSAFDYCHALTNIQTSTGSSYYATIDGVLYDKAHTIIVRCGGGVSGEFTIPDGVTIVGNRAFLSCSRLTNITIPPSVTTIGEGGFDSCFGMVSIRIPSSVTSIGDFGFAYCDALKAVLFDGNAPTLGVDVFELSLPPAAAIPAIYYRSDATGFGATFGGMATALIPQITNVTSSAGNVVIHAVGTDGEVYVLQSSTNLSQGVWTSLETNTVSGGGVEFNLPTQGNGRSYRVVIEL